MRVLVFEFITGGGLRNQPLPPALAREGEAMLQQLLNDLADCNDIHSIEVLRDERLPALPDDQFVTVFCQQDFREQLAADSRRADVVLPIAPETGNALLEVSELIERQGKLLLGSRPAAVRLTTSKQQTCAVLSQRGVMVVPSYPALHAPRERQGDWVVKPDNGAGGEGCRLINGKAVDFLPEDILQPLLTGTAASLNLLCYQGRADIYACNVQHVTLDQNGCHLHGLDVNGLAAEIPALQSLADAVASAIPDLWGWVGVDLILGEAGPVVLEINPRLTTSYVGLHESLQYNPAALLLQVQREKCLPRVTCEQRPVEIRL